MEDILSMIRSGIAAGFHLSTCKKMKSSGLKKSVSIWVQPVVKVSKELMAGVRGHRHTARTSFLMSWHMGEEWKGRGRRKDHFFKATPFLVPRTEIVDGMFPRGKRKRLEKQELVWGWRWGLVCKTILLFFCHLQERIKLFSSQGAGCLYARSVFGEAPLLSSCAVDGV